MVSWVHVPVIMYIYYIYTCIYIIYLLYLPDVLDGSMKGIMRIILAVAEKYNPKSVRPITQQNNHASAIPVPTSSSLSQPEVHFHGVPMSMRLHNSPKHEHRPLADRSSNDRPSVSPRNSSSPPPHFVTSAPTPTVNSINNNGSLSQVIITYY